MDEIDDKPSLLTEKEYAHLTHHNSKYTPEQKFEAVMAYYLHNSATKAAATLDSGITAQNITDWKRSAPWWSTLLQKCRELQNEDLEGKMTSVLHKVIEELDLRVRQGDKKLDKDGILVRVPVPARDLAYIAAMLTDKRTQLEGQGSSDTKGIKDQLEKVQNQLIETLREAKASLSPGIHIIEQVTDVSDNG